MAGHTDDTTVLEMAARADRLGDEYDRAGNDAMAIACWETAAELYELAAGTTRAADRPQRRAGAGSARGGHGAARSEPAGPDHPGDTAPTASPFTEGLSMLVLSRKLGEKIMVGDDIVITVVDIDRGKIRLGIEAPRDLPIYRQELIPLAPPPPPAAGGER